MPIGLVEQPQADPDAQDQASADLGVPNALSYQRSFAQAIDPAPAVNAARNLLQPFAYTARGLTQNDWTDYRTLSPDEANSQYGLPGYKRFNAPIDPVDAAFQGAQARQAQMNDMFAAHSNPNPLFTVGASLAGGLLNPTNLALAASTDGLGEFAMGFTGLRDVGEAGSIASRIGRVANVVGEGAVTQVPFVAANAAIAGLNDDDYTRGDALRDLAVGAILHTGLHYGMGALARLGTRTDGAGAPDTQAGAETGTPASGANFGQEDPITGQWDRETPLGSAFHPDPAPIEGVPDAVRDLPPTERQGAFVMALDQMAGDHPVDVGQYVDRALNPDSLGRLDEATAAPDVASFRPLDEATAVTPRGTEVPVRYGLVELGDLSTSHDDNLSVNPDYPAELQPRDRMRAGAQARNFQLESELNPKLLMNDISAGGGAPIVSPDGVVESGNGRTIALRRSAARGGDAYARYRAELKAQGFDTEGMTAPALVRMRTEAMDGPARAALAREMNADVTERMGAVEQAQADASRISDASFDHIKDNEGPATSRAFARDFIARVAPDQANTLAGADGTLSPEGARRIKAAVLARAYGDPRLVGQIFEDEAAPARQLGEALAAAAPAWARLRAAVARGEVPAALDLTAALRSAMDLVRHAVAEKIPLGQLIRERLGQTEMFGGEAIGPQTEAFLRLFYRDEDFTKPLPAAKIAWALREYARQALEVTPGPDLFGGNANEDTARQILANLNDRFARGDAGSIDLRAPGKPDGPASGQQPEPLVIDVQRPGGDGERAGREVSPQGGDGPGGEGFTVERGDHPHGPTFFVKPDEDTARAHDLRESDQIFGWDEPGRMRIEQSLLHEGARGKGLGLAMYERAAQEAAATGKALVSDWEVSADAARVWEALKKRGYDVERSPKASKVGRGDKAYFTASDGASPVFEIKAKATEAAPRAAAAPRAPKQTGDSIIAADPELKALLEDTLRLAAENGVEIDTPENQQPNTVAEAIRAAAVCLAEEEG